MKEIKENKHKLFCLSEELSNMIVIMWTQQNADERIEMLESIMKIQIEMMDLYNNTIVMYDNIIE